ncbi:MAG: tetratricopeptide repeat protein [Candidatus Latescibacteria bacterium]|nr:tetratricopeptide repeat protein [Candidatus Latescibacterota bacterium]NIO77219.1 tetratricopeptide repeat protein [Candidatus Latescibacterota bacterium]
MKKRDWEGAIKEYCQLAELDKNNPNVYNELGDLYLKVDKKQEALRTFDKAVDAYTRVGLFNNAVAVCKKLLRLHGGDYKIIGKLGNLRKQQGFLKEATTYFLSYLEKIVLDVNMDAGEMKKKVAAVAEAIPESPEVLEQVADYLLKWEASEEATNVLTKLHKIYESRGMEKRLADVQERLSALGARVAGHASPPSPPPPGEESVQAEEKLWMEPVPTESEGIEIGPGKQQPPTPPESETIPSSFDADGQDFAQDFASMGVDGSTSEPVSPKPTPTITEQPGAEEQQSTPQPPPEQAGSGDPSPDRDKLAEGDVWIPDSELPDKLASQREDSGGEVVHVSQIIDEFKSEIKESVDEEDYRSHYDLGMAYLEMDFLPEAIREFQIASKSSAYRIRSLEMIGLCFLNQNQPNLAIKQLIKGLEIVEGSERETLGLRYNLGLAYEMVGEYENAKSCFEDVYVVDVTFREVADKIKQYSD